MKLKRRGLIGTIVYHLLLLLLLIFAGLTFPDPPPEEEGILVNFGTDDTGFGDFEPIGDDQNAGDPNQPIVEESPEIVETTVEELVEASAPEPDPTPVDNTQDVEEVKVKEKAQPTAEEIRARQEAEAKRIKEIEQEKIRQEEERVRQEAEKARLAELQKQQDQAERLSNLGEGAFGKQGVGEKTGSEGEAGGEGNQGVTTGTPDADRYGVGGGLGNNNGSYGLGSRKAVGSLPKPLVGNCQVTSRMVVKVEIQVDRQGIVVAAMVLDASYQDGCIWDAVVAAAKKTRFSSDPNASFKQTGWIRYTIEP